MSTTANRYRDPSDPAMLRWWDGAQWTEHTQPMPGLHVSPELHSAQAGATDESVQKAEEKAVRESERVTRAEEKRQAKEEKRQAKAAEKVAFDQAYGEEVISRIFGNKTVVIYRYGYVQVRGLISRKMSKRPERLVSIEASSDVQKNGSRARRGGGRHRRLEPDQSKQARRRLPNHNVD